MFIQIEVNKNCNLRCWFCQNAQHQIPPNEVMSLDNFRLIMQKVSATWTRRQLNLVAFAAYNEPTLDPFFKERLIMLDQMGFNYWWISNGTNMTEDLVDFLAKEKIIKGNMHFNMPSCEPARLAQLTNVSAAKAIKYLQDFEAFMARLPELGVSASIGVHGNMDQDNLEDHRKMSEWAGRYGLQVSLAGAMDRAGMLQGVGRKIRHQTPNIECAVNYLNNLYVGVTGAVYMCCHDYYQTTEYGNLLEDDPHELLCSIDRMKTYAKLRREFCMSCEFAKPVE